MKNYFRKNTLVKMVFIIFPVSVLLSYTVLSVYSENVNRGLAQNLIRLHIIANSDSAEDQALKLDVRDAIIDYMNDKLEASSSIEETRLILADNMDGIKKTAETEIASHGADYEIRTMVGNYPFPTKEYGDVALPAGNYEALRVVIGQGSGQNWWCVLFPPLCFVDATHGEVPSSVKNELKETLTKEEYKIITTPEHTDVPVRIRFKVIELYQNSKMKFAGMLSRWLR